MRTTTLLLLGGLAVSAAAGRTAALHHSGAGVTGIRFAALVRGAMHRNHPGRVAMGAVSAPGAGGVPFTITLGADGGTGAVVLTRVAGGPPTPGRYPVGESAALDSAGGFRMLYLAGSATRPEGVFRGERGTLEITAGAGGRLGGRLEAEATGFLAEQPEDETRRVRVSASFGAAGYGLTPDEIGLSSR